MTYNIVADYSTWNWRVWHHWSA